ncbi:MAG: hypothetical protein AAF747_10825 [Planctomycetota bacterium]
MTRGDKLFLGLTGNLEANFNKLHIYIDSESGGENTIAPAGVFPDSDGFRNGSNGLTFDSAFSPDHLLIIRRGGTDFDVDYVRLGAIVANGAGPIIVNDITGTPSGDTGSGVFGGRNVELTVAYNDSNMAGIGGNQGAAADQNAALAVTTGLELSINLAALAVDQNTEFKISVMQNNQAHNFLSNQLLGGLPVGTNNLGGDGASGFTGNLGGVDLNQFAGDQFFTVPTPGAAAVLGLGGLAAARRRR